jgi:hypothetical protein
MAHHLCQRLDCGLPEAAGSGDSGAQQGLGAPLRWVQRQQTDRAQTRSLTSFCQVVSKRFDGTALPQQFTRLVRCGMGRILGGTVESILTPAKIGGRPGAGRADGGTRLYLVAG